MKYENRLFQRCFVRDIEIRAQESCNITEFGKLEALVLANYNTLSVVGDT